MHNNFTTSNILHIEDDYNMVRNYVQKINNKQGIHLELPDDADAKMDGEALEIVTGYWWAASIEEAVKCIDRMSAENILFDFVLIDRKLTGKEQSGAESSNSNEDPNKAYLTKQFPWYNQKSYTYTGDFLFLYLCYVLQIALCLL